MTLFERAILLQERGMDFQPSNDRCDKRCYHQLIERLGWKKFVEEPEWMCRDFVLEFYSKLPESEDGVVMVKGKPVSFSAKTINEYYELEDYTIDEDDVASMMNKTPYQMIFDCLNQGRQNFFTSKKSLTIRNINFSQEAKVWRRFISSRIYPTSNYSQSTKKHYIVLINILLGRRINVGRIIYSEMLETAKEVRKMKKDSRIALGFSNLITSLCQRVQVPLPDRKNFTQPPPLVSYQNLDMTNEFKDDIRTMSYYDKHWKQRLQAAITDETSSIFLPMSEGCAAADIDHQQPSRRPLRNKRSLERQDEGPPVGNLITEERFNKAMEEHRKFIKEELEEHRRQVTIALGDIIRKEVQAMFKTLPGQNTDNIED